MIQAPFEVNVSSRYGAPMGRRSDDESLFEGRTVQVRRVPAVDHDYDPGGAYWGGIEDKPLFCAWGYSEDGDAIELYVRASDRDAAIKLLPEGCVVVQPELIKVNTCPDAFFYAYVECALWSCVVSRDEDAEDYDKPLDDDYSIDDLDADTATKMRAECDAFYASNANDLYLAGDDQSGHDFWLTRNHHGAGFWDREELYGEEQAERLTKAAHEAGEVYLYVQDGKVYSE